MTKHVFYPLLLCYVLLTACMNDNASPPPVPEQVRHLPVMRTTLGCTKADKPPGVVHAYEFPGLTPSDNSTPHGLRGNSLFIVPYCTVVEVLGYAWSPTDEIYYVRIRLANGLEGWVVPSTVGIP